MTEKINDFSYIVVYISVFDTTTAYIGSDAL